MNGQRLKHDPYPVCLGVTLDRYLSYREHLSGCHRAGTTWSRNLLVLHRVPSARTLSAHQLWLCYSIAEYCCVLSCVNQIQIQISSTPNVIAPDFRLPATHAALMAASAQQCCTCFSTSYSGNRLYASNHQSPSKLACVCWCLWASTSTAFILTPGMVRHDIYWYSYAVERTGCWLL